MPLQEPAGPADGAAVHELERAVVDTLPEGVVVLDERGRAVLWNDSALRLLGRPAETLAAAPLPLAEASPVRHGDRWLAVERQPLRSGRGGTLCSFVDVTERVEAERRLRDERDRAQGYLDVASTIIVALDVRGRVELIRRQGC